ncbi:MAG TPA: bifunctional pyr operon transcriptional regulator/uracil phosphoribosyltransferase PyrR [Candidatus Binatia bacterium]|nr:bifunctional pyr operon transcriptional regulator/uracil phosphoribosyltransferase PyrR [Candidatus Binatia bacterium]
MTQVEPAGTSSEIRPPQLLDAQGVDRVLLRLAHEIRERHPGDLTAVVLAGIREGGLAVARRLRARLGEASRWDIPLVAVDVSGFRDDRPRQPGLDGAWQELDPPGAAASPEGLVVVLVDDVIQTGRTMRAAFDLVASRGRPAAIEMAVLVDRGGREVPVRPNYVGKNLPVAAGDWVEIRLGTAPEQDGIFLVPRR